MTIRALVKYKVLGDDEYVYIEPFETQCNSTAKSELDYYWRVRFLRNLIKRNILSTYIEDLSVEYVRD